MMTATKTETGIVKTLSPIRHCDVECSGKNRTADRAKRDDCDSLVGAHAVILAAASAASLDYPSGAVSAFKSRLFAFGTGVQ
jgi:hypothetical protein